MHILKPIGDNRINDSRVTVAELEVSGILLGVRFHDMAGLVQKRFRNAGLVMFVIEMGEQANVVMRPIRKYMCLKRALARTKNSEAMNADAGHPHVVCQ